MQINPSSGQKLLQTDQSPFKLAQSLYYPAGSSQQNLNGQTDQIPQGKVVNYPYLDNKPEFFEYSQESPLQIQKSVNIDERVSAGSLLSGKQFQSCEPIQVQCENCHTYSNSVVFTEYTKYTYISGFLGLFCCLCWVPFVFKQQFQKISHICPGCDRELGQADNLERLLRRNGINF